MERDEDTNISAKVSNLMGAIFMCNRTTKKECFRRKLFGLPSSQSSFVRKVKAGMALFLFEYEERKLYGVFEAASDGVMNSVPGAYSRSGSSFQAQVHFTSLWTCHPLSEYEFRGAIQENYFAPYKFNFGLSYEQVAELIELFSSKKISPHDRQSLDFHSRENDMNSKSRLGVNHSMYNQNPDLTSGHRNGFIENRSYSSGPSGIQPRIPSPMRSPSQIDYAPEGSFRVSPKGYSFHHIVPSFGGEQPSDVFSSGKPFLNQKLTETQDLHFRSHFYPSHQDLKTCNLPSTDYLKPDSFYELGVDKPNLIRRFSETQVPHFSSLLYPSQQDTGTFGLPCTSDHGLVVSSSHGDLPFQTESYVDLKNYVNYDPSTSKSYATNGTDSLHSVLGVSNSYGYTKASQEVDNARGSRYWNMLPDNSGLPLTENENLVLNVGAPQFPSRYSSEPCVANEFDGSGDDCFSQGNPITASAKLHSDIFERRTSVFSRLKAPKGFRQRDKVLDADSTELLWLFSQRRNQWNKMAKVSKRMLACSNLDGVKKSNGVCQMEPIGADSIVELANDSETFTEESFEAPFLNFKRRSDTQNMDDGTEGSSPESGKEKCKRRKLIRPSFPDDDPFVQTNKECQKFQSSSQEIVALKSTVLNGESYANNGKSALKARFGNGEHMNPKDYVEGPGDSGKKCDGTVGVSSKLPICLADERIMSSKDNVKVVSVADAIAEAFSVESSVECTKASGEKFHVVRDESLVLPVQVKCKGKNNEVGRKNEKAPEGNSEKSSVNIDVNFHKISNMSHKAGGMVEAASTADIKCEGGKPNEIAENNKTFFKADFRCEGNNSAAVYERGANFSNTDSAVMEEDHSSKSDLNRQEINSHEVNEKTEMLSSGNAGKVSFSSVISHIDLSTVNSDVGAMVENSISPADLKCVSSKSDKDTEKEDNLSDGNTENISLPCNINFAQVTVKHEAEEVEKNFISTTELKNEGNSSALLVGKDETSIRNMKRISLSSGAKFARPSYVKSGGKGVKAGQMLAAAIECHGKKSDEAREKNRMYYVANAEKEI